MIFDPTQINIGPLLKTIGLNLYGKVNISHPDMSGLAVNPKDDWLYLGVKSLKKISEEKEGQIRSAAFIGSGNGIETIAALKLFPNIETIYVTDLLLDIQSGIVENIQANAGEELKKVRMVCLTGRDCAPLPERADLIFANLPLVMFDQKEIVSNHLATTTLTDASQYLHLSQGDEDCLKRWSLLSQLGFLMTAKEKIKQGGTILTFIGGRIPFEVTDECFRRAGLEYRVLFRSFKYQAEPMFLKQYAEVERNEKVGFAFYDYCKAVEILQKELGIEAPDIIPGNASQTLPEEELKKILEPALVNADGAYRLYLQGRTVGHLAYAFEAFVSDIE